MSDRSHVALGLKASTLGIVAVALGCPLVMFLMMRTMMRDRSAPSPHDVSPWHGVRSGAPARERPVPKLDTGP